MRNRNKKGITLVELVLSVFIFSFVMLSIFSLYSFSIVETYKQTHGLQAHTNSVGSVEKHEMGVMRNVDKSKNITLFEGLQDSPLPGSGISVEVTAKTFDQDKKRVVAINSSDEDLFEYLDMEHGRVGKSFAQLLLPTEVDRKDVEFPDEYKNKIATYFVGDKGNFKHSKMDFKKYDLPKGDYQIRYLVYDIETYKKMLKSPVNSNLYMKYKTVPPYEPLIEKTIYFSKRDNSKFSSSKILGSDVDVVDELKLPITKKEIENWNFLTRNEGKQSNELNELLNPGKYMFVFELTIRSLDHTVDVDSAMKSFQKMYHFSGINDINLVLNNNKLIARDVILVENLKPNVFVNAGKELYIGSNFDGFNLTKHELGKEDGTIEYFGVLPNADVHFNWKKENLPNLGFIYNRDDMKKTSIYGLDKDSLIFLEKNPKEFSDGFFRYNWDNNSRASLSTYASSTSPYGNRAQGATFYIDTLGQIMHSDERSTFATGASAERGIGGAEYFKSRNNRLFNANTLNIALLDNGQLLLSDAWMYTNGNRYHQKANTEHRFLDLYVDLGNNPNTPTSSFLGITKNKIVKINTKYKVENNCDFEDLPFVYLKYVDFPNSENLTRVLSKDVDKAENLGGYSFDKIFPLSKEEYLIFARKNSVYELFKLIYDPFVFVVDEDVMTNKRISVEVNKSKTLLSAKELEAEKDLFEAEVIEELREKIKQQVISIRKGEKTYLKDFEENLKKKVKSELNITKKEEVNELNENTTRMIGINLEETISEYLKGIKVDVKVTENKYLLGYTLEANVKKTIDDFDFHIEDGLNISRYAIVQTLYPKMYADSPNEFLKEIYQNNATVGFEIFGNDLYAYVNNKLYRLVPKGINNGQEVLNEPIKILELEEGKKIKNVYIHDKIRALKEAQNGK